MAYQKNECDVVTKYRLLTKFGGLANKDIRELTGCSGSAATKIIGAIHRKVAGAGKLPNEYRVSPAAFMRHMGWDFETIQSLALKEIAVRGY